MGFRWGGCEEPFKDALAFLKNAKMCDFVKKREKREEEEVCVFYDAAKIKNIQKKNNGMYKFALH